MSKIETVSQPTAEVYAAERIFRQEMDICNELDITTVNKFGTSWEIGRELRWGRLSDIQAYVDQLSKESWFKDMVERHDIEPLPIVIRDSKTDRPNYTKHKASHTLSVPDTYEQKRASVVAHEMAHIFSGGHGQKFRQAYLEIMSHVMNGMASALLGIYISQQTEN